VRVEEAALEGPTGDPGRQKHGVQHSISRKDIPGLCLAGDTGVAGFVSFCCAVPFSSSARMLSRRASTPATAWERKEPHRADIVL
jgi:hypothetical protein